MSEPHMPYQVPMSEPHMSYQVPMPVQQMSYQVPMSVPHMCYQVPGLSSTFVSTAHVLARHGNLTCPLLPLPLQRPPSTTPPSLLAPRTLSIPDIKSRLSRTWYLHPNISTPNNPFNYPIKYQRPPCTYQIKYRLRTFGLGTWSLAFDFGSACKTRTR